jgi:hypothetical protein
MTPGAQARQAWAATDWTLSNLNGGMAIFTPVDSNGHIVSSGKQEFLGFGVAQTPEPATLSLIGGSLVLLGFCRRKKA